MKNLITIFILLIFFSCNCPKNKNNSNIEINARLIRSYDSIYDYDTEEHKTFDVRIVIKNKSDKLVTFWIMTCDWENNFKINNDYICFNRHDCDGNYAHKRRLKPNDSLTYNCIIRKFKNIQSNYPKTTRFGLIYIDSLNCSSSEEYHEIMCDKSKQEKIIWSNPLYLNKAK